MHCSFNAALPVPSLCLLPLSSYILPYPFFFLVLSVHCVVCGWRDAVFRRRQCDGRSRRHALCYLQHHALLLALGATGQASLCWPQVHVGELQTWVKTLLGEGACLLQAFSSVQLASPVRAVCCSKYIVLLCRHYYCVMLWHGSERQCFRCTSSVPLRSQVRSQMYSNSLLIHA